MSFSRQCRVPVQNASRNHRHNDFKPSSSSSMYHNNGGSNSSVTIGISNHDSTREFPGKHRQRLFSRTTCAFNSTGEATIAPPLKRRKSSSTNFLWDHSGNQYQHPCTVNSGGNAPSIDTSLFLVPEAAATVRHDTNPCAFSNFMCSEQTKPLKLEEDLVFMSRDEIESSSPSRKDGIDLIHETHLRYSYCAFLQNLGMQLELPQTTIGTAMVLCHRFFVCRSHACHDRFLTGTAALFLAAKYEETPRPLNTVLRASCEICHKQNLAFFSYLLPVDWFEQYKERVIEAEQMILTTLDFELNVQHPYIPLTSVLNKLGLSQTVLVNLALNLVSEGLRSSLWLQFKPHHIAAGAAFLAAKFLNFDLDSHDESVWQEFQTTPSMIQDVVQQLMELF